MSTVTNELERQIASAEDLLEMCSASDGPRSLELEDRVIKLTVELDVVRRRERQAGRQQATGTVSP